MLNILFVGDFNSKISNIEHFLNEQLGTVHFQKCTSAKDVFEKADEKRPDLILFEYLSKKEIGEEFCQLLKTSPLTQHTPIILISEPNVNLKERANYLLAGADALISKPIDNAELIASINVMLRLRKTEEKLRKKNKKLNERVKAASKALHNKTKRYAEMFDAAANIIILIGKDKKVEEWNTAAEAIFEIGKNEAIGRDFAKVISNKVLLADIDNKINSGLDEQGKNEYQISIKSKSGQKHHILWSISQLTDSKNELSSILVVGNNVSKLKYMEDELRESENFFKDITDSANDAIILIDKYCRIYLWNKAAEQLFGYKKNEIINQLLFKVIHNSDNKKKLTELIDDIRQTSQADARANIVDLVAIDKKNKKLPVEFSISTIRIRKKRFWIIIAKDISLRKKTIETLREAKEKAEEADRLKSSFLSNMSHEIRTPMNAIVGFSQLLANSAIDDSKKSVFIEQINLNSESLLQLIEDIIYVSKIEAGKIEMKKSMCLMNFLLDELHTSFVEHKRRMGKEQIKLMVEKQSKDPNFAIFTDPQRFKQIMTNLIGNAIKFTDTGSVTFGYEKNAGNKLLFYVKDTGLGIKKEKIEYVFDRFTKISATKTKLYGGTGLGLSITQHLVEQLGGEIWVESIEDAGSEFYFTHPYQQDETKHIEEQEEIEEQVNIKTNSDMSLEDTNILIAEDEQMNYFFLQEALALTGANIEWAKNGLEAVNFIKSENVYHVVLMDMKMPVMDGYEATAKIKELQPAIPVIAQTAYAMPEEQKKGFEAGCDSYLSKPVDPDLLINTIKKHLNKK